MYEKSPKNAQKMLSIGGGVSSATMCLEKNNRPKKLIEEFVLLEQVEHKLFHKNYQLCHE